MSQQGVAPTRDDRAGRFRGDVEGLRAVAVGLVLLYHAGLPWVPGGYVGVDVFFVISGFLITTQLVSELHRDGRISLPKFYARRAKRLLPAAAIVLGTTAILVRLFVPTTRWENIGGDIVSSALYFVNWRLAERSVDYLAEGSAASPVQHFWSLAVEEQFYLVWPLLILLAAVLAKAARRRVTPVLWVGLAAVAIPSFAWAIIETADAPARAFFVTTTRMWELAIGAAVALAAGLLTRLPKSGALVIGWSGLAAIGLSGLVFSTETPWPGYSAALPTLGTAAVIAAGFAATRNGPVVLLGTPLFRWVGGLSYSLYLWHWPLLAVAAAYWGDLSIRSGLAIVVLSVIPAWLTYRLVENPLRYSRAVSRSPRFALSLGANFTLAGVVAGLALLLAVSAAIPGGDTGRSAPGAAVLAADPRDDPDGAPVDHIDWITPDPLEATSDIPDVYARGCHQDRISAEVLSCHYGNTESDITVAVAGDSKIVQWLPALRLLAEQNGWHLTTYTKSGCTFASVTIEYSNQPYVSCRDWGEDLLNRLVETPPDYLVTSQRSPAALDQDGEPSEEAMIAGLRRTWSTLTERSVKIIVIADNPHPGMMVYECVAENRDQLTSCTYDRDRRSKSAAPVQKAAADGQKNVTVVDLFDAICPTERCAPVIGNVLVYRQGSHLTATYVETMTPRLSAELLEHGLPIGSGKE